MEIFADLPIFKGNQESECLRMLQCFHAPLRDFQPGEVIYTYGQSAHVGVLHSGTAVVVKIDVGGSRTILERLTGGGVFGELIAFSSLPCDSVTVVCETPCKILFLSQQKLTSPCEKVCDCHRILMENMLSLISKKAFSLSERVEVLSCRSIREKLLCCFRLFASKEQKPKFTLPFSLSALADYICSDRSAMMRELRRLKEDGLLQVTGKEITFLKATPQHPDLCEASLLDR